MPQKAETIETSAGKADVWWIKSTPETCAFFGVSHVTLQTWVKAGAPKVGRGKWDVKALMEWKYKSNESAEKRRLAAEATLKEAKSEMELIRLEITKGNYVETASVTAQLRRTFSSIKKTLLSAGHRVATELNVIDPEAALKANKVVDDVIYQALTELAEGKNIK